MEQPSHRNNTEQATLFEVRLKRLRPQPCGRSAADILRAAGAQQEDSPQPTRPLPWSLLTATGLGGVVVGALLAAIVFFNLPTTPATPPVAEKVSPTTQHRETTVPKEDVPPTTIAVHRPAEKWSHSDLRVAEQLGLLSQSSGRLSPLSANSVARPALAKIDLAPRPAVEVTTPNQNEEDTSEQTMRSTDARLLLQDLLGV